MKIQELLQKGKRKLIENEIEDANLIARVLLQFVLQVQRKEMFFINEQEIEIEKQLQYEQSIEKIVQGIPMQYITNYQEFMKLPFYVNENVLIPRPDTEILVEDVLEIVKKEKKQRILDLCTGSGCIGISLAFYLENVQVSISDISKNALEIAEKNIKENNVEEKIKIIQSNLFENIEEKFDIIVSNPPYIETKKVQTLSKQVQKEPKLALDGGEDGLNFYKKIIEHSPNYLKKDGYLCLEIGYNQKEAVEQLLKENRNFKQIHVKQDLAGNNRVVTVKI